MLRRLRKVLKRNKTLWQTLSTKCFLLIAKWIPVAVAAGILINNTLAMLDVKDVILDLFDITVGSSLAFVIMMYACSYVFNFCYWHKIVITYDLFVLSYILLIRYTNIGECSDGLLLTIHYILAGIFIALIWYVKKSVKLLIKKMVDYKKALVAILENTLENVNAGNTNITEEEASVIIDHLTMLNKGVATVSKAYACEHVLHITSNKFDYLVRKGMVDGDGLLNDMIDRLIVSKANTINGVTIGEGSIKVTIPFMNKTVIFDKDDFNELKTNIEKYGKSE